MSWIYCLKICHAGKNIKKSHSLLEFAAGPPGLDANSGRPWNLIHSLSCRTSCRLFIHEVFFGPLGLHLGVWSELGRSLPFWPMRTLRLQWSQAFSLVCEMALRQHCSSAKIFYCAKVTRQPSAFLELNISKAYEKVSYDFLFQALNKVGISRQFIESTPFQYLIFGNATPTINLNENLGNVLKWSEAWGKGALWHASPLWCVESIFSKMKEECENNVKEA